jgi:DNA polymerase-3 subunit delta'
MAGGENERRARAEEVAAALPGVADHAHAHAVLGAGLPPWGSPSHAYLLHGPAGSGKRAVARAFAAALLADGSPDPRAVSERVRRGVHPDLTWVSPSGAGEMLVADVEEAVVAAAARTPFESRRRVFVLEAVERMNDQAANRMLKTLEEPAAFVHLLLISDRVEEVLATIASRCQHVRFDALPAERIAATLSGTEPARASACARLAQGDARLAQRLASADGEELRARAEEFVRGSLGGAGAARPWLGLLDAAREAGAKAGEDVQSRLDAEAELLPAKERRRQAREAQDARRRQERRARTATLDLGLRLGELWLRDVMCVHEGAPELVLAADRREELERDARGRDAARLRSGVELVDDTRLSLALNVNEELALEALAYRLGRLLAAA